MNVFASFAASLTSNVALLLVAMPLIGAALVRLMNRSGNEPVYFTAVTNVCLCCGLVVLAVFQLEPRTGFEELFQPQMLSSLEWPGMAGSLPSDAAALDATPAEVNLKAAAGTGLSRPFPAPRIAVAINGLNLWFVALTVAATTTAVCRSVRERDSLASRLSWLLLTEAAFIGTLVAQDVILLSGFNFLSIIGLFFLIGYSAHPDRRSAARRFFRVQFGAGLMLTAGLIGAAVSHWWMMLAAEVVVPISFSLNQIVAQVPDLAMTTETGRAYWIVVSPWLFLLVCGACLLRIPLPPLHHWWLSTVERSDRGTSSLLACGFLPTGLYILARIVVPLFAERLAEISTRLMTLSLVVASLLAMVGLKLAREWRDAPPVSPSDFPATTSSRATRLIGVALVVSLSVAFGSVILGDPLAIRGGLLIAVSAVASAGLAFWLLTDHVDATGDAVCRDPLITALKWLTVCGLVAMPGSGSFWGLLMSAHGFMRLNAALALFLVCSLVLFGSSFLRASSRQSSTSVSDRPRKRSPEYASLLPFVAVLIITATCPTLICGPPPVDETEASVTLNHNESTGSHQSVVSSDASANRNEVRDSETNSYRRRVQQH
jgi:NADH:ubiquinone oxidoreductase subunit 4 (subunit M)